MLIDKDIAAQRGAARVGRWVLGLLFIAQGVNHFIATDWMVRMMPQGLPAHRELVWLSGVAEIVVGVLALGQRTRVVAGWGIVGILVAVFPANVNMALHPGDWPGIPSVALWLRLPFQLVFVGWAWGTCIRRVQEKQG